MSPGGTNDFNGEHGNNKKKKIAIIIVAAFILMVVTVVVTLGITQSHSNFPPSDDHSNNSTSKSNGPNSVSTTSKAIKAICQHTDYRETCEKSLTSIAGNTSDPEELIRVGFKLAIDQLNAVIKNSTTLKELAKDPRANQALENCKELVEYAIDDLDNSFTKLGVFDMNKLREYVGDLKVWISGALTYEQTCLDGFENTTGDAGQKMKSFLKTSMELTTNGLAMVTEISNALTKLHGVNHERTLSEQNSNYLPSWITEGKRRLLQANVNNIKADVVVAKDGSGKYKTINEALRDVPKKSNKTFVIHVKTGIYNENVLVDKSATHVMMIGDGPTKTVITSNKNFIDGTPTFKTATVSVIGSNFIAKDMGFENSAGAAKHQAVALRVQSDQSIFYNCRMDGYQDTLYTQTHRQFYRECTISGTIDFIFGNAAVVFQNCKMIVRKPLDNQSCMVTAQGRMNRREPGAIILQNCTISGDPEFLLVKDVNKAYLGRPWKEHSRTIIMQSQIDDIIQPEGWMAWQGTFALNTLFYSEYNNSGPGSIQTRRVTWRGIKKITPDHIVNFTPGRFIHGDTWIKPTGIPYVSGMIPRL